MMNPLLLSFLAEALQPLEGRPSGLGRNRLSHDDPELTGATYIDVVDYGPYYAATLQLPGVALDRVSVRTEEGSLHVTVSPPDQQQEGRTVTRGVRQLRFDDGLSAKVAYPILVDSQLVEAKLLDGVLTVTLPKKAEYRRRDVQIQGGDAHTQRDEAPELRSGDSNLSAAQA